MTLLARLYLVTNKWNLATEAADMVLQNDKRSTKARLVKAEALFNVCQFEHAMVHFYRGMVNQQKMHNAKKRPIEFRQRRKFSLINARARVCTPPSNTLEML